MCESPASAAASTPSEPRYAALDDVARDHLGRGSLEQHPAEVEHVDAVAHLLHERHVVLDEQDPEPAFGDDVAQDLAELLVSAWSRPDDGSSSRIMSNGPVSTRASSTRRR